jgi:hypothetical protein
MEDENGVTFANMKSENSSDANGGSGNNNNSEEILMTVIVPRSNQTNQLNGDSDSQFLWLSTPPPPPLYSIKQLNYSQVTMVFWFIHLFYEFLLIFFSVKLTLF